MPRSAWVIQITPVRLTSTSANDASVVRKIYLSIDPIGSHDPHPPSRKNFRAQIPEQRSPLVPAALFQSVHSLINILLNPQPIGCHITHLMKFQYTVTGA